jgi:hypothetical protein
MTQNVISIDNARTDSSRKLPSIWEDNVVDLFSQIELRNTRQQQRTQTAVECNLSSLYKNTNEADKTPLPLTADFPTMQPIVPTASSLPNYPEWGSSSVELEWGRYQTPNYDKEYQSWNDFKPTPIHQDTYMYGHCDICAVPMVTKDKNITLKCCLFFLVTMGTAQMSQWPYNVQTI